ncbi:MULTISPECIES: hypothetical protein [unclassified Bacillus cereus group]|uniref:hypothetical protein n=1 Tax=unclassified Bacillus cereus group TaxID=2750818 RepID=UPI001F566506|nr:MULTISPECIES: hypothetical protein [unclassified Bacillus cereus group]
MRSKRISRLIKRFGKETTIYRKLGNDKKDPYKRGGFELQHNVQAIVDEVITGAEGRFEQGRIPDMADAVLYCETLDIRAGDKVVQREKEYRVKKVANPYNTDDHIECILEHWG